jgi:acetoin utilization deacetylase AcuC-like enzyme
MKKLNIVWDEKFLLHDTGDHHPESKLRLTAIKEVLDSHKNLNYIPTREASLKEILLAHTQNHYEEILNAKGKEGFFDMDTPYSQGSVEAALLSTGGILNAVDTMMNEDLDSVFAYPRPPGHHAESDRVMGFCFFNHVAIAANYLLQKYGLKKIAIIDYDVHHGNGTQEIFYHRDDVFYISTHQYPYYPGTGAKDEIGHGRGEGFTLNIPFNLGVGDEEYIDSFQAEIIPKLEEYKPEFIIISAGFDAHKLDPLAGINLSKNGFYQMSLMITDLAKKLNHHKTLFVLEGGYSLKGLKEGVESVLEVIG